jgi:hypothetical protein
VLSTFYMACRVSVVVAEADSPGGGVPSFLVPGSCSWRKKALDSHATLGLHTYTGPGPGQAGSAVQALGSLTGTDEAAVGQIDEARIATATSVLPTIC